MPSRTSRTPRPADATLRALPDLDPRAGDTARARTRLRRFLTYYRPHLPLLAADLACAILVAATALALPICANFVVRRLTALHLSLINI